MLNCATDHTPRRVVLYARVSTERQASGGYSLAQQMEALREHAAREGYEVLEEVVDRGHSGATLQRPGIDRVRHLVAAGGVSAVLAQDRDRIAREPTHHRLLQREFEERGCKLGVLNDLGIADDRLAEYERAEIVERTWRGKLRKAREGRIVAVTAPNYGFRFNPSRDGYEVDEDKMRVVRRIFYMVGVERRALNAVKRTLEAEQIPTPTGKKYWVTWVIRRFLLDDVYRPHAFEEVANLVTPEVAARLDPDKRYGIWWFNRERWTSRQVLEASGHECAEHVYRRRGAGGHSQEQTQLEQRRQALGALRRHPPLRRLRTAHEDLHHAEERRQAVLLLRLREAPRGEGRLPEPQELPRRSLGDSRAAGDLRSARQPERGTRSIRSRATAGTRRRPRRFGPRGAVVAGEAGRSRAHAPRLPGNGCQGSHDPRRAQREAEPTREHPRDGATGVGRDRGATGAQRGARAR